MPREDCGEALHGKHFREDFSGNRDRKGDHRHTYCLCRFWCVSPLVLAATRVRVARSEWAGRGLRGEVTLLACPAERELQGRAVGEGVERGNPLGAGRTQTRQVNNRGHGFYSSPTSYRIQIPCS